MYIFIYLQYLMFRLFFHPFPPIPTKTRPFVILLCLMPDNFLVNGEPLSGKWLTGPICQSPFLNPFPPRPECFAVRFNMYP